MSDSGFPLPPPTFEFLVFSLKTQTEMQLGLLRFGEESDEQPNLPAARHAIDLLAMIAERYRVPYEVLMQINKITKPEALQAGQTIKVVDGPFHAKVYRSTFTMDLYLQNTYVRSFKVGLGKPGMETPTGLWRVKPGGKLVQPIWTNPVDGRTYHPEDPDYPLGSRWIALEGLTGEAKERTGFAIHGTKEPDQLGAQVSQGCIRMYNGDAILMYNLLVPTYSQVEITD